MARARRPRRRYVLGSLVLGALAAGTEHTLAHADAETAYFASTALVLVGGLAAIVAVFAVASSLAVRALEVVLRSRARSSYILFLGWNMLRSQRQARPLSRRLTENGDALRGHQRALVLEAALASGGAAALWALAPRAADVLATASRAVAYGLALLALIAVGRLAAVGVGALTRRAARRAPRLQLRSAVTVPNFISMVGVGVGVWALILVLSVMSGFQSQVRQNVLATDAHVLLQPASGAGPLPGALEHARSVAAEPGVQSAEAYFEGECMIASSFNSRVKLTVRGVDPTGPMAQRLAEVTVDGAVPLLAEPERLVSFRGLALAEAAGAPPERASAPLDGPFDSAPRAPTHEAPRGIVMPPIPGGDRAPTRGITMPPVPGEPDAARRPDASGGIVMPRIPGATRGPRSGASAIVSESLANALELALGASLEVSVVPRDGAPPRLVAVEVIGIYRRTEGDVSRPDLYVGPRVLGQLEPGAPRLLVTVRGPQGAATPATAAATTADSPDLAAVRGDLLVGDTRDLDGPPKPTHGDPSDDRAAGREEPRTSGGHRVLPGIALGVELADSLRVRVGDELELISLEAGVGPMGVQPKAASFRVAAIFRTGIYDFDLELAYLGTPEALRFFDAGGEANRVEVRLDDATDPAKIRDRLLALVPDVEILDWKALNRNLFSALQLEKIVMFLVLGLIIAVASFNIVASLAMLIQEKSTEIAILRAMGGTRRAIRRTFLTVGAFVGGIGAATGTTLGIASCALVDALGVPLPPQYYIPTVPVRMDPLEVAAAATAAVVISLLATLYPASAAARLRPVEGLRYE